MEKSLKFSLPYGKFRNSRLQIFFEIGFLKISQYSQENTCAGKSF